MTDRDGIDGKRGKTPTEADANRRPKAAANGRPGATALLLLLTPLLFVLAPMLSFYAQNADELRLAEMLPQLGVSLLAVASLTAIIFAIVRRAPIAALWASALTASFFYYGYAYDAIARLHLTVGPVKLGTNKVLAGILLVVVVALVLVSRRPKIVESAARAVAVLGLCFVAGAGISTALAQASLTQVAASPPVATPSEEPTSTPTRYAGRKDPETMPDIYFVVLDGYASNSSLQEFAGYDNSAFTGALERKGFYVAKDSKSAYSTTFLSLASTLNMEYVNDRVKSIAGADRGPMYSMIANNRVKRMLKENGYSYVHVASGWAVTDKAADADYFHESGQNELNTALLQTSMFRVVADKSMTGKKRATVQGAFAYLEDTPKIKGPKFVFAHILVPHGPYVFKAKGDVATGSVAEMQTWNPASIPSYVGQLQATNAMTLRFVDTLLRERKRPTFVVIQGDHGTMYQAPKDPDPLATLQRRRHSILNAVYYSEGPMDKLEPSISPVNTLRLVVDVAVGARLPRLANRSYFSRDLDHPYDLIDVTGLLEHAPEEPPVAARP